MQSCPNCGSEARDGARFCTSCGLQFPDASEAASSIGAASADQAFQTWQGDPGAASDEERASVEGWPSAPAPANPEGGSWGAGAFSEVAVENAGTPQSEADTAFWPEPAPDAWPSAPNDGAAAFKALDEPDEPPAAAQPEVIHQPNEISATDPLSAIELLDQLRAAILGIGTRDSVDLRGVISDLEVAVTPPGAVPADDLAELRDAIFLAREKPRDIDTIVDLTRRIDGLAALVIAYDRAVAAIERSLEVLKKAQDGESLASEEENR